MRRTEVINVILITHRHVGGIINTNKDGVEMRNSENTYSKVICKPRISTDV